MKPWFPMFLVAAACDGGALDTSSLDTSDSGDSTAEETEGPETDPIDTEDTDAVETDTVDTDPVDTADTEAPPPTAVFYQFVGIGENAVFAGSTTDGLTIDSAGYESLAWEQTMQTLAVFGDPVISLLPNGEWAMTASTGNADPDGVGMFYAESSCPDFPGLGEEGLHRIEASSDEGCAPGELQGGKRSQIFEADGEWYLFHMVGGEIWLSHLGNAAYSPAELSEICLLNQTPNSLADLAIGQGIRVISHQDEPNLLMSDTAIARRSDNTWVLFVKGIPAGECDGPGLCELCARGVYRATSTNLQDWSPLERIVDQASIPDATVDADGKVWLYWQDFSEVCDAQNEMLGVRAPISAAYEDLNGDLVASTQLTFPDEAFETNEMIHYATNANPVHLPTEDAWLALQECFP